MINTTLVDKRLNKGRYSSITSYFTRNTIPSHIKISKAKGTIFYDDNGKEYLDFSSQTLNLNFGQNHSKITRAVIKQVKNFTYLSSRFENPIMNELVEKLLSISPSSLQKVNLKLVNGSDTNESALKRIRKRTGKDFVITYHKTHLGESSETLSASGKTDAYIGGSGKFILAPPPFSSFFKDTPQNDIENLSLYQISKLLKRNKSIAGIFLEPIMVNAGVYGFSPYYLKHLRKLCDDYQVSLVFDEIQTAFGWLGTYFACQYFGVVPDLLTMGKGLAAGFPLAGILMEKEYDVLDYGEDEYTYGGHPASCAAAIACLNLLKETDILKQVKQKCQILNKMVLILQHKYSCITDVRLFGLICGIEFKSQENQNLADKVYNLCLENGLLLRKTEDGKGSSLVLKPPIIVSQQELEKAIDILDKVLRFISVKWKH